MEFDADDYVSGLSMAELMNILEYGANLATYDERKAATAAAQRRLSAMQPPAAEGGAGASGGLTEGGGTWDGIYADGSSQPGYGGDVGRGTNEIPIPVDATPPLSGGPGIQDPSAPGITDWGGANIPAPADPFAPPQAPVTPPLSNGMGPDGGQIQAPQAPQQSAPMQPRPNVDISQGGGFLPGSRNNQFYTNQFQGLLNQQGRFRDQQAQAKALRAATNNQGGSDLSWDWLDRPLPEVDWGDGTAGQGGQAPVAPTVPAYNPYTPVYSGGRGAAIIQGGNKPL